MLHVWRTTEGWEEERFTSLNDKVRLRSLRDLLPAKELEARALEV